MNPFNNGAEANFTLGGQSSAPMTLQVLKPRPFQTGSNEFSFIDSSNPDSSAIQVSLTFNKPVNKESVIPGQTLKFVAQTNPNANVSLNWNDDSNLIATTLESSSQLRGPTTDLNFRLFLTGNGTNVVRDMDGKALDGDKNGRPGGDYWSSFTRVG